MLTLGQAIDSISNSRLYCFTSALLGWVRMSLREVLPPWSPLDRLFLAE